MADDLKQSILEKASGLKKASGDAGSVEQHDLVDQIAADKHIANKNAMLQKGLGIKLLKISPPGCLGCVSFLKKRRLIN